MIEGLIYDRTAEDVANKTAKGFYRYTDLNRVQNAMLTIADRFREAGYDVPEMTFTTWTNNAIPMEAAMDNYIFSVLRIRSLLNIPDRPHILPSMSQFTFEAANNIEKLLWMMDDAMDRIQTAWYYSDEIYTGEVDA